MMYCSVPGCGSKMGQSEDVVMHEFPSNMERRERWIAAVRALRPQDTEDPWLPSEYAKVCSKHFTADDYIQGPKKRYLAPHAVPSRFQSTAAGKSGKGRRGRPRKILKEETSVSVSAASAPANEETATTGDPDRTPLAKGRTNKPVVIRRLRGDEASASESLSPVPVIVDVRSESCHVGSVFRPEDPMPVIVDVRSERCDVVRPKVSGQIVGFPPGVRALNAVGRIVAQSIACQTLVTGLTISAYEEQIQSLKNDCKRLRHELFSLRRLAQARKRCRECDSSVTD